MLDIEAINLANRIAILTDGRTIEISHLFDENGHDTDNADLAIGFVVGDGGYWFSDLLNRYQQITVH